MRTALNGLYTAGGAVAAFAFCMIGALTFAEILARLLGTSIPSAGDFAGYSMAASSFLGLAYTLRKGGHIRVRLLLDKLPPRPARAFEIGALLTAVAVIGYFAYYVCLLVWRTYTFGEFTLGLVPIRKWIPMTFMAVGIVIFFIAFLDDLIAALSGRDPSYVGQSGVADEFVPSRESKVKTGGYFE
ncbi:MAG: TRAP transporter small permease [Alphaproteobacteria bacterium]|nr:TRAP transporter small permease [Alphaproteobacteria bacterium]